MHEMSICQGLIRQVESLARENRAGQVDIIVLSVGPLSGVDPELLHRAFTIARMGSVAQQAELLIETGQVKVKCRGCGSTGQATVNHLLCPACGDWKVNLVEGDELLLLRLELSDISKNPA